MRQVLAILAAAAILGLIYSQIDVSLLLATLARTSASWLALGVALLVPIILLTAWRLQSLVPGEARLPFLEANKLILAAVTLNMVLPSHMGDLAKAYFLTERGRLPGSLALSLVVFERLCDLFALFAWCLLGLAFYAPGGWVRWPLTTTLVVGLSVSVVLLLLPVVASPVFAVLERLAPARLEPRLVALGKAWRELSIYFRDNRVVLLRVTAISMGNWFLHALQIWVFILALGAWAPFGANLVLAPLALLIGILPITFAGIGTRDAALIFLYSPFFGPVIGAALGLLSILRYLVPGLAGLPFLARYLATIRARQADLRGGLRG